MNAPIPSLLCRWSARMSVPARVPRLTNLRWRLAPMGVVALLAASAPPAVAVPVARQTPASPILTQAAATITAATLAEHLAVLTADSLRGRATPSPALDRAARYVTTQFNRLGLTAEEWRYPIPGQLVLDPAASWLEILLFPVSSNPAVRVDSTTEPIRLTPHFNTAAYFAPEVGPPVLAQRPQLSPYGDGLQCVLLAGRYTAKSLPLDALRDKIVIYVPFAGTDSAARHGLLTQLFGVSAAIVVASRADSAAFGAQQQRAAAAPIPLTDEFMRKARGPRRWPWVAVLHPDTAYAMARALGLDLAQLQADPKPLLRELPRSSIWLIARTDEAQVLQRAPAILGVLEGTDSTLKREYLAMMAHMDDAATPGADDNTAGVAGLLTLAKAFSQPGARPRRSLLFFATSGGAADKDSWAANAYFADSHSRERIVSVLNLDRIGPLAGGDSLLIDGLEDVELASRPEWLAASHPELGLVVADGGTVFRPTSDHFPFVRRGIPGLFFHTGGDAAPGATIGHPAARPEEVVRLLQLVFYLGEAVASETNYMHWSAIGRRRFGELARP